MKKMRCCLIGSDFICLNRECKNHNTKIVVHSACPIIAISRAIEMYEETIDSAPYRVDVHHEILEHLKQRKEEGGETAVAPVDLDGAFEILGTRVQHFCLGCLVVWNKDVLGRSPSDFDYEIDLGEQEKLCPNCQARLLTAEDVYENSIACPSCGVALDVVPWFVQDNKNREFVDD